MSDSEKNEPEQEKNEAVEKTELISVVAEFDDPQSLFDATAETKKAGYKVYDAYSPFPIHGIDDVLVPKQTMLPWIVFFAGSVGGLIAIAGQYWTNAVNYPYIISGKPLFSLPANIPVTFELIVLFSAFAAFFGMWALNRLPRLHNPLFNIEGFSRVTDDKFFLAIEASDPKFKEQEVKDLLDSTSPVAVHECRKDTNKDPIPIAIKVALGFTIAFMMIPPALIAKARTTKSPYPRWHHPIPDMDYQEKVKAQTVSDLFADGRGNRPQVKGTIARGQLDLEDHKYRGIFSDAQIEMFKAEGKTDLLPAAYLSQNDPAKEPAKTASPDVDNKEASADENAAEKEKVDTTPWATYFPYEVNEKMMNRGQRQFNIYCSVCHGLSGDGDGLVTLRALELGEGTWVKPVSLYAKAVVEQPVGKTYNSITNGVRNMPAYGHQINNYDRWAIILYLKALQRSRNASLKDVPADVLENLTEQE